MKRFTHYFAFVLSELWWLKSRRCVTRLVWYKHGTCEKTMYSKIQRILQKFPYDLGYFFCSSWHWWLLLLRLPANGNKPTSVTILHIGFQHIKVFILVPGWACAFLSYLFVLQYVKNLWMDLRCICKTLLQTLYFHFPQLWSKLPDLSTRNFDQIWNKLFF